ncbi:MAG TPA: hypothetical protein PK291_07785, partial [Thermotogota bacterium]|nr:hypothetical protein [Thermotogota bacterium]
GAIPLRTLGTPTFKLACSLAFGRASRRKRSFFLRRRDTLENAGNANFQVGMFSALWNEKDTTHATPKSNIPKASP